MAFARGPIASLLQSDREVRPVANPGHFTCQLNDAFNVLAIDLKNKPVTRTELVRLFCEVWTLWIKLVAILSNIAARAAVLWKCYKPLDERQVAFG